MVPRLFALTVPFLILPADPWVNEAIEVDKTAEAAILRESQDAATELCRSVRAQAAVGATDVVAVSTSRYSMFVARARLAWCERRISDAYRATEFAVFAAEDCAQARFVMFNVGGGTLDSVIEARERVCAAKLALLRFKSIAAQQNLDIQPATREMAEAAIEEIMKRPAK